MAVGNISVTEWYEKQALDKDFFYLLDVREMFEYQIVHFPKSILMPMHSVPDNLHQLPKDQPILVICHHGVRSEQVAYYLNDNGFQCVFNLIGGIDAWARQYDTTMVTY